MNRYPLWKYVIVAVAMLLGLVYTLPNFFRRIPCGAGFQRQSHAQGRRQDP
jgi:hypothetical protein